MTTASAPTRRGDLGFVIRRAVFIAGTALLALVLFPLTITVASAAAIPLAGLLAMSRPREPREFAFMAGATTLGLWWLADGGELPGQVLRAGALISGFVFVSLTLYTRLSTVHRAIVAVASALGSALVLLVSLPSSWNELTWWVQFRVGLAMRALIGAMWTSEDAGLGFRMSDPEQLQGWLESTAALAGELYGAIVALTLGFALYVAMVVYRHVATRSRGLPSGRFSDLYFSEHFGWVAVIALLIVLIPKFSILKTLATNVLVVGGALYALRGAAVFAFFLEVIGGGFLLSALLAVIIFLLLPVVAGGAVLLGVLDTGMDFRRRWGIKAEKG